MITLTENEQLMWNEIYNAYLGGRFDRDPTNVAKFASANEYCLTNNYTFTMITESNINI